MTTELVCGLKLTHDGTVCLADGDRLVASIEVEKVANAPRYQELRDIATVEAILDTEGVAPSDLDAFCVDGWLQRDRTSTPSLELGVDGGTRRLEVAGYLDHVNCDETLDKRFVGDPLGSVSGSINYGRRDLPMQSFQHATDHVFASYCTSPFARELLPALILVWDGYMLPCLYQYDPLARRLTSHGPVAEICGGVYPAFASLLESFRQGAPKHGALERRIPGSVEMLQPFLNLSGKAMALAGLSEPSEEAMAVLAARTQEIKPRDVRSGFKWSRNAVQELRRLEVSDAGMVATLQDYLYRELEAGLERTLRALELPEGMPLCLSGGCGLNIKWNSALRKSGLFSDVWVPPFPNDAGSAIGAVCTSMVERGLGPALEWDVFSGPLLSPSTSEPGWSERPASIGDVARILHVEGEPVVVLSGRSELGPRALGHRSIIAPAVHPGMKDHLNTIKGREWYRPVAPICLESKAPEVFSPGTRDPYMLFDHVVRSGWRDRIPAIVHADGTARLQTVGDDNPLMQSLLEAYQELSGVPVLCNTSANLKGCGFFPDVASAQRWGGTRYVWSDGRLFEQAARSGAPVVESANA